MIKKIMMILLSLTLLMGVGNAVIEDNFDRADGVLGTATNGNIWNTFIQVGTTSIEVQNNSLSLVSAGTNASASATFKDLAFSSLQPTTVSVDVNFDPTNSISSTASFQVNIKSNDGSATLSDCAVYDLTGSPSGFVKCGALVTTVLGADLEKITWKDINYTTGKYDLILTHSGGAITSYLGQNTASLLSNFNSFVPILRVNTIDIYKTQPNLIDNFVAYYNGDQPIDTTPYFTTNLSVNLDTANDKVTYSYAGTTEFTTISSVIELLKDDGNGTFVQAQTGSPIFNIGNVTSSTNAEFIFTQDGDYKVKVTLTADGKSISQESASFTYNKIILISGGGGGGSSSSSSNNDNTNVDTNTNNDTVIPPTCGALDFLCNIGITEPSPPNGCSSTDLLCNIGITQPDPVKEVCDISISPSTLSFSGDAQVLSFVIDNKDSLSYTPDFKIGNINGKDSAKSSIEILNSIGTIQPNGNKEIGVKFNVDNFNPLSSENTITLIHSTCADEVIVVKSSLSEKAIKEDLFLGGAFSNSKGNTGSPQPLSTSEILNKITGTDIEQGSFNSFILSMAVLGSIAFAMSMVVNVNNLVKGKSRKAKSDRRIVNIVVSFIWAIFISLILRSIITLFL